MTPSGHDDEGWELNGSEIIPADIYRATLSTSRNFEWKDGGVGIDFLELDLCGPTALQQCPNCLGNDWECDEHRGDLVCQCCGFCDGGLLVSVPTGFDKQQAIAIGETIPQQSTRDAAFNSLQSSVHSRRAVVRAPSKRRRNCRPSHNSYKRIVYFRERISQWLMEEPEIDEGDWEQICASYLDVGIRKYGRAPTIPTTTELRESKGRLVPGAMPLTKSDVRSILSACDAVISSDIDDKEGPRFIRRYFEKWIKIRWRLTGFAGTNRFVSGSLVEMILEDFPRVEQGFRMAVQPKYGRKAMSYNEFTRRLMELYSMEDLNEDFPSLKTDRARKRSYLYWWHICKYQRWPFLCNENKILKAVTKAIRK